jgi:hypothetical protein
MIDQRIIQAKKVMQQPCMGEPCKNFIIKYINKYHPTMILEFGSGGSTLMFRELGCKVITIEHDLVYHFAIKELIKDIDMIFPIWAGDKKSYLLLYLMATYADLVFIDGKWREELMNLYYRGDFKSTIMVHDSEREEYQEGFNNLRKIGEDISPEGVNLFVCKNKSSF